MSRIHKFVEDLAKARKTPKEIKTIHLPKPILPHFSIKEQTGGEVRTDDFIEAVRVYVEFETSINTIFHVLHDDLGLSINSQRITKEESEVRTSLLETQYCACMGFWTKSKRGSSQWLPKGSNPPLKFKRQESRKKQMVLSFFDNCGVIFQHYLPMRTSVTAAVFKGVMNMFLKKFKEKRPEMAKRDWYFHFDNAPCHTANSTKEFLAKKGIKKMLEGVEIVDKSVQKE
ncbi:Uncharacterized protein FKW44_005768 [Caligus rogercresseyi]|uniref:Histone-lysine N-methyltransferase SETMAR n=1 Tax=Caligus rogercresseyi TaxID=217165 RepID=A0A7T8KCE5_CALRO|nr:Uncharacterized protein FKW44_005768 [Caligus rogercresseyi]